MTEFNSTALQELLDDIQHKGYVISKLYAEDRSVLFVGVCSKLQRKPFLLDLNGHTDLTSSKPDILLELGETDYRSFRQAEYLKRIDLSGVACLSKRNMCVKKGNCYLISGSDDEEEAVANSDDESDDCIDIEIDDYPIEDILPVFTLEQFKADLDEEKILESYATIYEAEEEINEDEVNKLLEIFDEQKAKIKELIFEIHKEEYNIRRDLSQQGTNLQRVYALKERSSKERDRVRFKIERLALETEKAIDSLNDNLCERRIRANKLLHKCRDYIERFDFIN